MAHVRVVGRHVAGREAARSGPRSAARAPATVGQASTSASRTARPASGAAARAPHPRAPGPRPGSVPGTSRARDRSATASARSPRQISGFTDGVALEGEPQHRRDPHVLDAVELHLGDGHARLAQRVDGRLAERLRPPGRCPPRRSARRPAAGSSRAAASSGLPDERLAEQPRVGGVPAHRARGAHRRVRHACSRRAAPGPR